MILFFKNKFCACLVLLITWFGNQSINAQCTGCTTVISSNAVSNYTAATNQTLCVSSGFSYTGTIVLNGGTICNQGTLNNVTFLKGTFNNYGNFTRSSLTSAITGTVNIHNFSGSTFSLGAFIFSATNAAYVFQFNVYKGATAAFTGAVTHNSGSFRIEVAKDNPGGNPISEASLNVTGLFTTKTAFNLLTNSTGTCNFTGIASLEGTGIKSVTNYGQINFGNNLNMVSAGSAASTVTINNYNKIDVAQFVNASYTAGKVFINNYTGTENIFHIAKSITLSRTTNTLTNNGNFIVDENFNIVLGLAINTGTIVNNILNATGGTITNNSYLKSNANFSVTNSAAIINNNNTIEVVNTFSNIAKINLAANSYIYTKNYYNSASTSSITGPTATLALNNYPRIFISDISNNLGGYVSNKIILYDASLTSTTSNIGKGFDAISSSTRIAASVLFASNGVAPGNGNAPTYSCSLLNYFHQQLISSSNAFPLLYGNSTTLTSDLNLIKVLSSGAILSSTPVASSNYSWQPTNSNEPTNIITPIANQVYTASSAYLGCSFTNTILVTLSLNVIAKIDHIVPNGVDTQGNIILNVGGGTGPYTYTWMPGNTNNKDLTNATAGSYSVTVKDNSGTTLSYDYKLGFKTNWKSLQNMAVRNDSIISINYNYAQGVTKNTLRQGTNGWVQLTIPPSGSEFMFGFTDSLSRINGDYNDIDFAGGYFYGLIWGYINGSYYNTQVAAKYGDVLRVEKINSDFNLVLNGTIIFTTPVIGSKNYKLKLLNYYGPLANIGSSFADSTNLEFPNYVLQTEYVKHSSGLYVSDGTIVLTPKNNEVGHVITWQPSGDVTNTLTGQSKGTKIYTATDLNNVSSSFTTTLLYKAKFTDLQGAIFRNDSLISDGSFGFGTAVSKNIFKANQDGEVAYYLKSDFHQIIGFLDTAYSVNGEYSDIDFGIYNQPYPYAPDLHNLYLYNNGTYTPLGLAHSKDKISIKRVGNIVGFYINDWDYAGGFTVTNANIDWRFKVGANTNGSGYAVTNVGCSFNTNFRVGINKDHADYTNPINGSVNLTDDGNLPYKSVWSDGVVANTRNDLFAKQYFVDIYADSSSNSEAARKIINIGTKPLWQKKLNANSNLDSVWVSRHDSLGVLVSYNMIDKIVSGEFELKVTNVNQDMAFGFFGSTINVSHYDSLKTDSVLTKKMNLGYAVVNDAVNNALIYVGGKLSLSSDYSDIHLVRIHNGQIQLLLKEVDLVNSFYNYRAGDIIKVGRSFEDGKIFIARNDTILYRHNIITDQQYFHSSIITSVNSQVSRRGVIIPPGPPVIIPPKVYAVPKQKLDGGYHSTNANQLLFISDGLYNHSALQFKVFDKTHTAVLTNANVGASINSNIQALGDNRYILSLSTLVSGYYILEITNEKNEKLYLRFKR